MVIICDHVRISVLEYLCLHFTFVFMYQLCRLSTFCTTKLPSTITLAHLVICCTVWYACSSSVCMKVQAAACCAQLTIAEPGYVYVSAENVSVVDGKVQYLTAGSLA